MLTSKNFLAIFILVERRGQWQYGILGGQHILTLISFVCDCIFP